MNITDVTQFIAGLNRIAEGATMLAGAIEQAAWERIEDHADADGVRPVAAAELREPEFEAVLEEPETQDPPVTPSDPAPEPEVTPEVSLVELRSFLAELSQQGMTAQVRRLILDTGAPALSGVAPARYGELMAAARRLANA